MSWLLDLSTVRSWEMVGRLYPKYLSSYLNVKLGILTKLSLQDRAEIHQIPPSQSKTFSTNSRKNLWCTFDHVSYLIRNKKFMLFVCSVAVWDIWTQHWVLPECSFNYIIRIYKRLTLISTSLTTTTFCKNFY